MHPEGYEQVWTELPMLLFVPLTQGKFAVIESEMSHVLAGRRWYAVKIDRRFYAGCRNKQSGSRIYMHRNIAGADRGEEVDHRNRDGLDNRRSNLRKATRSQNEANKAPRGRSGFKGVSYDSRSQRYTAHVGHHKKWVGSFVTAEDAAKARDRAAREMFGEFAFINFPEQLSA
jgi:hypothetical protein